MNAFTLVVLTHEKLKTEQLKWKTHSCHSKPGRKLTFKVKLHFGKMILAILHFFVNFGPINWRGDIFWKSIVFGNIPKRGEMARLRRKAVRFPEKLKCQTSEWKTDLADIMSTNHHYLYLCSNHSGPPLLRTT